MVTQQNPVRSYILKNISEHPDNIIKDTSVHFDISVQAVYKHIKFLLNEGKIYKRSHARFALSSNNEKCFSLKISSALNPNQVWDTFLKDHFSNVRKNVYNICINGFIEVLKNAVKFSEGSSITIRFAQCSSIVSIWVTDNGTGIYEKIRRGHCYPDLRECAFQLSKGILSSSIDSSIGQSLYLISWCFDVFEICANGVCYHKDLNNDDWYIGSKESSSSGTSVRMSIDINSERSLKDVCRDYRLKKNTGFADTHILVDLAVFDEENFLSRTQARRILHKLNKFSKITLDFTNAKVVGNAFVDEIFRVFHEKNPDIELEYINANPDIEFMIKSNLKYSQLCLF